MSNIRVPQNPGIDFDLTPLSPAELLTIQQLTAMGTSVSDALIYREPDGDFKFVTIGTGLTFAAGTLSSTSSGGDVTGPATNTDGYIPQWDGANSKTLKDGLAVPAGGLAGLTALGTKEDRLTPVSVKTANYTANAGELVPCDVSAGSFAVTLPTSPADGTRVEVQIVEDNMNEVEVKCGGTDKIFSPTGPAGIFLSTEHAFASLQYQASTGVWFTEVAAIPYNFAVNFPGIDDTLPISNTDISINTTTRVLSIVPPTGVLRFFIDGNGKIKRYRKGALVEFPAFTDTSGIWYFYFDTNGDAAVSQTPWQDFNTVVPVYRILWNKNLFKFTVTAATAAIGDTYTNNGSTFTVMDAISGGTTLIAERTSGTNDPAASGNLTRATGAGTNPIVFSSWDSSAKLVSQYIEYHPNDMPAATHLALHLDGARWAGGMNVASNAITTGSPNADGRNTVLALTSGTVIDDNLPYTIVNDSTPTNPWEQDLGNTTPASLNATNSGLFKIFTQDANNDVYFLPATRFPFAWDTATNRPQTISSTGVRTLVPDNRWFVYFAYSTQNPVAGDAIKLVSAPAEFTSLANAQAYTWQSIQSLYPLIGNDNEIRPLYRIILYNDNGGAGSYPAGCKYSVIREIQDIRKGSVTATSAAIGSIPASSVTVVQVGDITSTNAQAAFEELDAEKAPLRPVVEKTTLVDADEVTGNDSAASFGQIRTTWANVKSFLKTYFDTLYNLYTDEMAQDAVGNNLLDTTTVNISYNDTTGQISADVNDNTSTQKVIVSAGGTVAGTRKQVNFIQGTNVTLTAADNPGSDRVDVTIAATGGSGSGDVVGPASATDNAIARFDTTTGKLIQGSTVTIADDGNLYATNITPGFRTQATSGGTTTLVSTDAGTQEFTGTNTQSVYLPSSGVLAGQSWTIVNFSTQSISVYHSGGSLFGNVNKYSVTRFIARVDNPTLLSHWIDMPGMTRGATTEILVGGGTTLMPVWTTATGTGAPVRATSPVFATAVFGGTTFSVFNTTSTTISAFGAATTMTIGGTPATTLTHNYSTNGTTSGNTKTVNIATGAVAGSTTAINIGAQASATTVTINGKLSVAKGITTDFDAQKTTGSINSYFQENIQNTSNGGSASSDNVCTADTGNETTNFIDMGINSSGYNDAAFNIGTALDGFLYTNGGNLTIGTATAAKTIKFHTGGTTSTQLRATISDASFTVETPGTATKCILTTDATQTLTNKRLTPRVGTTTSSATPTINTDNVDYYSLTAQTEAITSFTTNLSGTPTNGQKLWISITGTAARAITWGASFEASTVALPTTTVTTARLDVGFIWNAATSKWRCVGTC